MKSLKNLKKYNIYSKVLNTQDYGLPQNRPRVYIIGIDKKIIGSENFKFPEPFPLKIKVSDLMDKSLKIKENLTPNMTNVIRNRVSRKNGNTRDNYIVNANGSVNGFGSAMKEVSPCLLANAFNFYSTKYKRFLTSREYLRLQGFPDSFISLDNEKITKKQAGNSMSVNVLMLLLGSFNNFLQKTTPSLSLKLKPTPQKRC
jgi:DNA (cytosine-5)-methyltransferase 1